MFKIQVILKIYMTPAGHQSFDLARPLWRTCRLNIHLHAHGVAGPLAKLNVLDLRGGVAAEHRIVKYSCVGTASCCLRATEPSRRRSQRCAGQLRAIFTLLLSPGAIARRRHTRTEQPPPALIIHRYGTESRADHAREHSRRRSTDPPQFVRMRSLPCGPRSTSIEARDGLTQTLRDIASIEGEDQAPHEAYWEEGRSPSWRARQRYRRGRVHTIGERS